VPVSSSSLRPEQCPACAADPHAAPLRYCAPLRCYCGHPSCPAAASYQLTPRALEERRAHLQPVPDDPLEGSQGWALQQRALAAAARPGKDAPSHMPHTDKLREEWAARAADETWIDRL
jgi:hypothetical protein